MLYPVLITIPKIECDEFKFNTAYYARVPKSNIFINLVHNFSLVSQSVARILIDSKKYNYEWYTAMLEMGTIIKLETVKTKKGKNGELNNNREINYYMVKKISPQESLDDPFPFISGNVIKVIKIGDRFVSSEETAKNNRNRH